MVQLTAPGREKRRNNEANTPLGRATRSLHIDFSSDRELDRELPDSRQLSDRKINRRSELAVVPWAIERIRLSMSVLLKFHRLAEIPSLVSK
jgi:hypothetical protein